MATSLLSFPPELLVNIFAFLPIPALLKFSQTSRYSHDLAISSLHTLSLGIYPTRLAAIISRLAQTHYPVPKHISSAFFNLPLPSSTESSRRSSSENEYLIDHETLNGGDPHKVSVLIPDSEAFDYTCLLGFHSALSKSILTRHGGTLRNLDISIWTLTTAVAKALAELSALRTLSLCVEDFPHVRAVPRNRVMAQRVEQRAAWELLANKALWASRLQALRVDGGELNDKQLAKLLSKNRWCRELWLCKCSMIGKNVWRFLGSEWEGRVALQILGIIKCGGQWRDEECEQVLDFIGGLESLQFLTLHGVHGLDSEAVDERNKEFWKIPECIPPQPRYEPNDISQVIEVDPAYLSNEY